MNKIELVFIAWPDIGHLSAALHLAHLLLRRNHHLSITVLIIPPPWETITTTQLQSLLPSSTADPIPIPIIILPQIPLPQNAEFISLIKTTIETQKQNVIDTVAKLISNSTVLAGFILDIFCTDMIDVANQLGVPTYLFSTSSAANLSLTLHLQHLYDHPQNEETHQSLNPNVEIPIPGFANPIPGKAIPSAYFDENAKWIHESTRRFRESNGILINTFSELESNVLEAFSEASISSHLPPVYAVGPILNLNKNSSGEGFEILKWLDRQPFQSVVFLCFGSRGSFNQDQVNEIAEALERSGYQFVWSLRQPSSEGEFQNPDYVKEVVPEGFLDRTAEIGRVIGWAPQVEILGHPATGGFVSHCGWNSILESLWFGVPIGTWAMYAEQGLNAAEMEVELGLAVGISSSESGVVKAEKIESGIKELMGGDGEIRKMVKMKSEESRKTVMENGSSFIALNRFIEKFQRAVKSEEL
ncbi:anthocyanidin 3-O-glucosyltransferase 2-like isoform X2 [Benincasa hispida]|uniref:anthocyanidin 3-O-glucosyltransferase 2-like isoform X2 n=1 Tax=Benincasa hispida TaxID=102211 RepID=UPI0019023428|nr:anthocyanidin 3-O-glucosyltransferase 2-like isoform X2 [Benincasa hispida]